MTLGPHFISWGLRPNLASMHFKMANNLLGDRSALIFIAAFIKSCCFSYPQDLVLYKCDVFSTLILFTARIAEIAFLTFCSLCPTFDPNDKYTLVNSHQPTKIL